MHCQINLPGAGVFVWRSLTAGLMEEWDKGGPCSVGIFQELKPAIAEPRVKLFRPQDERHPVVIR
jgi:hypothetical protein